MKIVGKSTDGKLVVSEISKIYFQDGIPLGIMFDELDKHNYIPSWLHLYIEMQDNGMNKERIFHLLNEHMFDTYGNEFRNVVINRLKTIFS